MQTIYKNKERTKKFKESGDSRCTYQNELNKVAFNDMAHGDFIGLTRRTVSDKILYNKPFSIAKNPKYDGYQRGLASMAYDFFKKKTAENVVKNEILQTKELAKNYTSQLLENSFKKESTFIFYR